MRTLECEIICPTCRTSYAQVFREPISETVFAHVKEPANAPQYCTVCEHVLVRK